ncbi:MAG: sulfatase-like hydrolase/transferase [Anaerolineales bacterium]|jgi:arylsulfatase A-like enzyme|uniref:sulfatase family protein n=1 Tax=Candidatus Villigracilis vicinus TaxID=3140679 RepID=UPI003134C5A6|nr:sulfatase-like hydrolase/transferase [Anaerolineales bacterium]MBK9781275.1 sulfatase-like hydrolase/transferase [Anaerolineales bacterium]
MRKFSRRDLLKAGWGILGSGLAANLLPDSAKTQNAGGQRPNIIMLICDAMTARNLSLYGYPRKTTPNLEKLAEKAIIYHNHYANGSFTVPGTSSLLTGLLPLSHRAVNPAGIIKKQNLIEHNIFRLLGNDYFKLAFSQNYWAANLLHQFSNDIDTFLPPSEFGLINGGAIYKKFKKDPVVSSHALENMFYYRNSLLLSFIFGLYYERRIKDISLENYPTGYPIAQFHDNVFTMRDLFDGIADKIFNLHKNEAPFFSYFHIFPPHDPYNPHKDFAGIFTNDGYTPPAKREHVLSPNLTPAGLAADRSRYDSFIANIDMEIGRLFETLQEQGVLNNTYFILTADHGEMFERGEFGHFTPLLYDPVMHIPLMVLAPGNQTRQDITTPTNNIDLLPTILNLAGQAIPASAEGSILPGLGGAADPERAIITVEAKDSVAHLPFTKATYSIIKGNYKLIHYTGYTNKYQDHYEFYDLEQDLEELQDKYSIPRFQSIIEEMKKELRNAIDTANEKLKSEG